MFATLFRSDPPFEDPADVHLAVLADLHRHGIEARATGEDHQYEVELDGETLVVNLHNVLAAVLDRGMSRRTQTKEIRRYVASVLEIRNKPKVSPDALWPAVRHRDYGIAMSKDETPDPAVVELPGDLCLVLMQDMGNSMAMIGAHHLEEAGIAVGDAMEAAHANLTGKSANVAVCDLGEGVEAVFVEDFPWLGSTIFAMPGMFQAMLEERGWEGLVAAVPGREELLFARLGDEAALAAMKRLVSEKLALDHPQSAFLFEMVPGDEMFRAVQHFDGTRFVHCA